MGRARAVLLKAVYFWGGYDRDRFLTGRSFRSHVRSVARKQGCSPVELDVAERYLLQAGLIERDPPEAGKLYPTVWLTDRGLRAARRLRVRLPPWT
jgi:DNA-binding MarR family transcriptional regulator